MEKIEKRDCAVFTNRGQKIFAVLHMPYGQTPPPAVVMCHGFGGNKSGRFRHYVKLSEALAAQGIASLRFDYRGSGDSEGDLSEMDFEGHIEDAHCAVDYLKQNVPIDKARIGMLGRSLGGAIAVKTASQRDDISTLALWVPLFSSSKWKEKWVRNQSGSLPSIEKNELRYFNGQLPCRKFLQQFFSLDLKNDLKRLKHISLLHMHAEQDAVLDASHRQLYVESRGDAQAETVLKVFPNQDHEMRNIEETFLMIEETSKWFKKNL